MHVIIESGKKKMVPDVVFSYLIVFIDVFNSPKLGFSPTPKEGENRGLVWAHTQRALFLQRT